MSSAWREIVGLTESNDEDNTSTQQTYSTPLTNGMFEENDPSPPRENRWVAVNSPGYLARNRSKSNCYNEESGTPTPRGLRRPRSSRTLSSVTSGPRSERGTRKRVSRKPKKHIQFRHYHQRSGTFAAMADEMESGEISVGGGATTLPINDTTNQLLVTLKYRRSQVSATEGHDTGSPINQTQRTQDSDIMRITSILNDTTQSTSPPPLMSNTTITASSYGGSAFSRQTTSSPSLFNDQMGYGSNESYNKFAETSMRDGYMFMFTRPEHQRYEDALVKIVGDMELPFDCGSGSSGNE
ncbi:hypothetical protein TSTA_047730 [Talaromyces stipitatus ATCC 10500]|uniref:Uncharacterized protein n=1 Tax=Talaromyces stipitatus (strain ATCC 10500 / CBS 375.48 / QM 6759 / NRRL 1006) TaxID=441959 RepID=B8MKH2_TALSN|nr:uncharacterized protein TSTA_047730 [Talaromyces stipitatus ATCC 10500]EED15327.1 hypothetical protein TSTA_047730 [Talaromyces stipitatus ATCC 10500]